jgi:hypothetical protein
MSAPDRFTTQHPARNAIVIVLLLLLASAFADIGTRVTP